MNRWYFDIGILFVILLLIVGIIVCVISIIIKLIKKKNRKAVIIAVYDTKGGNKGWLLKRNLKH